MSGEIWHGTGRKTGMVLRGVQRSALVRTGAASYGRVGVGFGEIRTGMERALGPVGYGSESSGTDGSAGVRHGLELLSGECSGSVRHGPKGRYWFGRVACCKESLGQHWICGECYGSVMSSVGADWSCETRNAAVW